MKRQLLLALGLQTLSLMAATPDFENYTETSARYDTTRLPIGSALILDVLAGQDKPLDKLSILDAGCGTGNYSAALVSSIGHLDGVDQNQGMLQQATAKLAAEIEQGKVNLHEGRLQQLPLDDASVDAVVVNQVLHHLDEPEADGFPNHAAVLKELRRVLRPGGQLIVNTTTHAQLDGGYWYYALIPQEKEGLKQRYPNDAEFKQLAHEAGFEIQEALVPREATLQGLDYFRGEGPLEQAWRDGDSAWALVNEERLAEVKAELARLSAAGELERYVREHDAQREAVGQTTFFVLKPV